MGKAGGVGADDRAVPYERLFLLNRCLEQVGEIIEQFRQDGVVHEAYAGDRQRSVEELRADLNHALTGTLHQRKLEACVKAAAAVTEPTQNFEG